MVTGPGEAAELLRRREVLIPEKPKFITRKSNLPKPIRKPGMHERVKRHVAT